MVGKTNSMAGYHLMAEDHSIQLGVWGRCEPPSRCRAVPWWELEFLKKFLNIGLKKMFEKLNKYILSLRIE